MKHELKTWTEYFQAVKSGAKTFEIRENDRNYQVGDVLWLREFIPCPECKGTRRVWPEGKRGCSQHCDECGDMPHAGIYTGEELEKRVTYITDFAQSNRRVVMALSENACPICGESSCLGNECSPPYEEEMECPECGTAMGINPLDGKLGCPHVACCYVGETPKTPAPRCAKCGAWLHETEQKHGCIMCQAKEAK